MNPNRFKWFYLIGFFTILLLPLLNLPPSFSPPDWGKTIPFRIIFSIILFVFAYQLLFKQPKDILEKLAFLKKNHIAWALVSLFGIFLLATIFSLDPHFSLWGSPYRSGGFVNFGLYITFAILSFLLIQKKDWQKLWDFSILVGVLVSIVALFQQFGIFKEVFVYLSSRPPSTIGITTALAIYLLLLSFITLGFAIKTPLKKWFYIKKPAYFLSFILFILVSIFITQARSAYIGLGIGFIFFFFFYPIKFFSKKSIIVKSIIAVLLILVGFTTYCVNTQKELPNIIKESKFLSRSANRLSIEEALTDPRISGWPIALNAVKARPVLGYGPENFSIGFDKFYNPEPATHLGDWWDRAHNIFMDISSQAGIPAFIIYLALFVILFLQMRKLKKEDKIIPHAIQATLLAYFTANIFSFDVFSTYLIFFLIVGYSLALSFKEENNEKPFPTTKYREMILSLLFIFLLFFVWQYNIKPFQINGQINTALYQAENKDYVGAVNRMEEILLRETIIDNYLRLQYISIIGQAIEKNPQDASILSPKAYEILKENIITRPYYTRNWMLLGTYTNHLIIQERETNPELANQLKEEADYYFQKANKLSPGRQEILVEWIKTDFYRGEYIKAKEKAQECINLNPKFKDCYWQMALSNIYLKNNEEAEEYLETTRKMYNYTTSEIYLLELVNACIDGEDYQTLAETYQSLIKINPEEIKYRSSLAVCYMLLGDNEKAREEAMKVLELSPESKDEVEEFLKGLN